MSEVTPTCIPDEVYLILRAKLSQLVAEPFERCGTDPETEVVSALGEIANIWPMSISGEAVNERRHEADRNAAPVLS